MDQEKLYGPVNAVSERSIHRQGYARSARGCTVRFSSQKGFHQGSCQCSLQLKWRQSIAKFPPKDKKPPIIIYDQNAVTMHKKAASTLIASGYTSVTILTGGMDAWQAAKFPVETGALAANIVYVPKPRPGEIADRRLQEDRRRYAGRHADPRCAEQGRRQMPA